MWVTAQPSSRQPSPARLSRYKAMKAAFESHGFSDLFEDPTKLDAFLATHRQAPFWGLVGVTATGFEALGEVLESFWCFVMLS